MVMRAAAMVDPRGCGGDTLRSVLLMRGSGRSPRVRGRLAVRGSGAGAGGSIPAGAGETLAACALIILQIVKER